MPAAAMMLANGTLDSTSMLQKPHRIDSFDIGEEEEECTVFGVLLSEDRRAAESNKWNRLILGSIVTGDASVRRQHCSDLRQVLHAQFPALNGNFVFLSRNGWPILRNQENSVRVCQVINEKNALEIQRNFAGDRCRLGILTQTAEVLGFIFCDIHATLQQVREAVTEQLKDVPSLKGDYQFTERNAWPVQRSQESQMFLTDVWVNDSITVIITHPSILGSCKRGTELGSKKLESEVTEKSTVTFRAVFEDEPEGKVHLRPRPQTQTKKANRKSFWKVGDKGAGGQADHNTDIKTKLGLVAKPILISYVRAEAAIHAIKLKEQLAAKGYSVYLDVHEIRTGNDWQDALNYAVSNCTVFVPLITPHYGMTQWTNREVKLADVLNKFIIPVNFLDRWPPECLAIQFASTQYISWKSNLDSDHNKCVSDKDASDYRVWEPQYIVQVAKDICERFKQMFCNHESIQKLRQTVKVKDPKVRREASSVYALDNNLGSIVEEGGEEEKKKSVVISAHPKDLIFAGEVKRYLTEQGFEVWSTMELLEGNMEGDVFLSSGSLSTIPEGETHSPRPKLPLTRVDTEVISEKRGLCRLSSQMSSIGAITESLTPEKIERLTMFQTKADKAGVVIILISQAFTSSSTSLQQIFYCEHRKKVILVKTDNKPIPSIYSMLIGSDMLTTVDNPDILPTLCRKVNKYYNNKTSLMSGEEAAEAKMQSLVNFLKRNLPVFSHCIYISGSSKLQNKRSEEICNAIGRALAKNSEVNIVTGGFFGAGDIVARSFEEARKLVVPNNYAEEPVVHILPTKDEKDFTSKANQDVKGEFQQVDYGKTFFLGDSVKERESAVARLFDICIVVEGGPGAAHEVEEFIWNDHFVIPIISSGGAASGQFGAPLKILEIPPFVDEGDWSVLSEKEALPEQVAEAVANIVKSLKKVSAEHAKKEMGKPQTAKKMRRKSRRSKKKRESALHVVAEENVTLKSLTPVESIERQDETEEEYINDTMCTGPHRWQKFWKMFKPSRLIS